MVLNDELYKRGFSQPYLRCVEEEEEAKYVLEEVHGGICGDHMGAKSLARKIMRVGYFWLTMQQDAADFISATVVKGMGNCHHGFFTTKEETSKVLSRCY